MEKFGTRFHTFLLILRFKSGIKTKQISYNGQQIFSKEPLMNRSTLFVTNANYPDYKNTSNVIVMNTLLTDYAYSL